MKKIISLTLTLLLVMGTLLVFPVNATTLDTVTSGKSGDCTWNYNTKTGELTISGIGKMQDYDLSDLVDGVGTYAPWYAYRDKIKSVTIREGVTSVGDYSFYGCINLTKTIIADSVERIGQWAFVHAGIKEISLPVSKGNTVIESGAFMSCDKLNKITIPEGVVKIGELAFNTEGTYEEIKIPASVTNIASNAFYSRGLKKINVAGDNKNYSAKGGVLYNKSQTKLLQFPPAKVQTKLIIPETVKTLGNNAFYIVKKLEKVVIPLTVKKIGYNAFCYYKGKIQYLGTAKQFKSFKVNKSDIKVTCKFKNSHKNNVFRVNETDGIKITSNLYTKDNATNFKTSNARVMRVSKNGKVRALKKGNATITTTRNGVKAVIKVTVK